MATVNPNMPSALSKTQDNIVVAVPQKGRFVVNLSANLANFGLTIIVGLWMTPYLIRHLGVSAFGLVPLSTTLTSYMVLFTIALNYAVGRFMTIDLDRQDYFSANLVFNTSFWSTVIVLIILLVPVLWLSSFSRFFFNVPPGYEDQFVWLFLCTAGVFFLTTLRNPFAVTAFCYNRFDLANGVNIAETFVRVFAILLLFNLWVPKVWHVGLAMLLASGAGFALAVANWHYLTPMLKLQPSAFSLQTLKQLIGMGKWIIIDQIGLFLFQSIDLVVVNKMLGAEAGGRYGAVMILAISLRGLAGVLATVFSPTIISLYGRQDIPGLVNYCQQAVKFVGLMMALPIGLVCGFAQPLLRIWLGPAFESLALIVILMSLPLCLTFPFFPLYSVMTAANRVRFTAILTCIMGVGNLGLAVWLAGPAGWGMYGVAAAGAIMLSSKNLFFPPLYIAHILRLRVHTFIFQIIPIIIATLVTAGACKLLAVTFDITNWFRLIGAGIAISTLYIGIVFWTLLSPEEREKAKTIVLTLNSKLTAETE